MQINTIHRVIGWFWGDRLLVENRTKYHYDKGNDVTVVERRYIDVHLYNTQGQVVKPLEKGHTVDLKV